MDFGTLISVAQKNETKKQTSGPCYQTKFTSQKKQTKQSRILNANVKKFLARKEEEEKQKALEAKRKKENLLALRDHKAQSRINKHLKVCKAANKSVIEDAVDSENTAITMAGPSQPDEDDYGYESQEAAALYNQFMSKYNSLPPEKPIFDNNEKRTVKDIASTKDRVKQALKQQELEESSGHRRKRKSSTLNVKEAESDEKTETNVIDKVKDKTNVIDKVKEEDKDEKPKSLPKKKPLPPPIGFADLLKLAEKKQHEPVVIEVKPKVEDERPMTKRQKIEYLQEKERKEQRDRKNLEANKKVDTASVSNKSSIMQSNKISRSSEKSPISNSTSSKSSLKIATTTKKIIDKSSDKYSPEKSNSCKGPSKNELLEERKKLDDERRQLEEMRRTLEEEKKRLEQSKSKQNDVKSQSHKIMDKSKVANKQISPKDIKTLPSDSKLRTLLTDNKPKQFPPPDIKPLKPKTAIKKPLVSNKRRIYDDDNDSDLDDFIDDGPQENEEDYSKHISEIFGYDRNKYKNLDDDDDDDAAMESNFAQQLKEEFISSKIGYMEDLEDMRMEAEEKRRKLQITKKIKK